MSDNIKDYTIESYAVFINVDESILLTNSFLEKFGYKFIKLNIKELEQNFSSLFSLSNQINSKGKVSFKNIDTEVSMDFFNALTTSNYFRYHSIILDNKIYFLKKINDFNLEIVNNNISLEVIIKNDKIFKDFLNIFIQQFRLFKNGDINWTICFQIQKEDRNIITSSKSNCDRLYGNTLSLSKKEAKLLGNVFKDNFFSNELTEFAVTNFNLSYEIKDIKTKYILLVTCLESLFNADKTQITHTISRHVALIISKTKDEFEINYKKIKKLYGMRSTIVHGGSSNGDLYKSTEELQDIVRQVINYCLKLNCNKQELFENLNASGFKKLDK